MVETGGWSNKDRLGMDGGGKGMGPVIHPIRRGPLQLFSRGCACGRAQYSHCRQRPCVGRVESLNDDHMRSAAQLGTRSGNLLVPLPRVIGRPYICPLSPGTYPRTSVIWRRDIDPKNGGNTKTRTSININKTKATTKTIKSNHTLYWSISIIYYIFIFIHQAATGNLTIKT